MLDGESGPVGAGRRRENGGGLVLFGIDGTLLLRASPGHAGPLRGSLGAGPRVGVAARVPAAGRTDTAIARDLATLAGVSAERFELGLEQFKETCRTLFAARCPPSLDDRLAPGMREQIGRAHV